MRVLEQKTDDDGLRFRNVETHILQGYLAWELSRDYTFCYKFLFAAFLASAGSLPQPSTVTRLATLAICQRITVQIFQTHGLRSDLAKMNTFSRKMKMSWRACVNVYHFFALIWYLKHLAISRKYSNKLVFKICCGGV